MGPAFGPKIELSQMPCNDFFRRHNPTLNSYHINGSPLKRVFMIKDLGIHFSPSLNFSHHIDATACKALKVLGFIKRNTNMFSSVHCLRTLYLSLVRLILEYGMIVWHPYLPKNQLRLERVQNRFLSYISFLFKFERPQHEYSFILLKINISTLSFRRVDADLRGLWMELLRGREPCQVCKFMNVQKHILKLPLN